MTFDKQKNLRFTNIRFPKACVIVIKIGVYIAESLKLFIPNLVLQTRDKM